MARIEGVRGKQIGWIVRIAFWMAKRRVGKIPEPMAVTAHHPQVFNAYVSFEYASEKAKAVDPGLKALASLKAATLIGCPF